MADKTQDEIDAELLAPHGASADLPHDQDSIDQALLGPHDEGPQPASTSTTIHGPDKRGAWQKLWNVKPEEMDDRPLWERFLNPENPKHPNPPEAHAFEKTMNYAGGLANTALLAGLNRVVTAPSLLKKKEDIPPGEEWAGATDKEWKDAFQGEAHSGPEMIMQRGYSPWLAYPVGITSQAISDPLMSHLGGSQRIAGAGDVGKVLSKVVTPEAPTLLSKVLTAAKQQAKTVPGVGLAETAVNFARKPVATLTNKLAEKVYKGGFRAGDSVIPSFTNSAKKDPQAYSNLLWNKGEPLVGGPGVGNKELMDQLRGVTNDTGVEMHDQIVKAGGNASIDLAPDFHNNIVSHIAESSGLHDGILNGANPKEYVSSQLENLKQSIGSFKEKKYAIQSQDFSPLDTAIKSAQSNLKETQKAQKVVASAPEIVQAQNELKKLEKLRAKATSLGPDITAQLESAVFMQQHKIQGLLDHASAPLEKAAYEHSQQIEALSAEREQLKTAKQAELDQHNSILENLTGAQKQLQDLHAQVHQDPTTYLKTLLYSTDKAKRAEGIELLAKSSPGLAETIRQQGEDLAIHGPLNRDKAIPFFDSLIGNLNEGPRSPGEIQKMKTSLASVAAGNTNQESNLYKVGTKKNARTRGSARISSDLNGIIDDLVTKGLGKSAGKYRGDLLDRYSTLIRGQKPMLQKIMTAERAAPITGTEVGTGIWGMIKHPELIPALAAFKLQKTLAKSPAFAARTGVRLNNLSQSQLPDSILRTILKNAGKPQKEE